MKREYRHRLQTGHNYCECLTFAIQGIEIRNFLSSLKVQGHGWTSTLEPISSEVALCCNYYTKHMFKCLGKKISFDHQ